MVRRGDSTNGLSRLRAGILNQNEPLYAWTRGMFLRELSEGLTHAGHVDEVLAVLRQGIDRRERTEENWLMAEFLRLNGELLARSGTPDAIAVADGHFQQAIDLSRRQGALAFELRAATSRARSRVAQGHCDEARQILAPVYNRFTEGFDTTDLKAAKALLDTLL
jgi:predicted ATPase